MTDDQAQQAEESRVRLDKWLWAARFYKTRSLAKEAIEGGKVQYNGQRTKPGKTVEVGAKVRLRQGWTEREVIVVQISERRRGAPQAQTLYEETEASLSHREDEQWQRKMRQAAEMPPARRPNKKQRRELQRLKTGQG